MDEESLTQSHTHIHIEHAKHICKIFTFYVCRSGFSFHFQSNEANHDMHCFNWFTPSDQKKTTHTQQKIYTAQKLFIYIDKSVLMSNAITIKIQTK